MPGHVTYESDGARATSRPGSWMLYGAAGYTGTLIAEHARRRGHQPVLAGRSEPAVTALAERLGLPGRELSLDDPAALSTALAGVDLVLNAAGPFLHTAAPLAEACLRAGVHYLDIGNELRVFTAVYGLDERARHAGITIMPGVGFGVIATNCLARYVSDTVGGAAILQIATRAATARQRSRRRRDKTAEHALRRLDPAGRPPPAVGARLGNHNDHDAGRAVSHHAPAYR